MNIESEITEIKQKLDALLSILGHGRTKTYAQIQREAEGTVERLRLIAEGRERRRGGDARRKSAKD